METIRLEIAGYAAGSNEPIENALRMVPGVISVRGEPAGKGVRVEVSDTVTADELIAALSKAGYIATLAG